MNCFILQLKVFALLINGLVLGVFTNLLFVIAMSTDCKTESFRSALPWPLAAAGSHSWGVLGLLYRQLWSAGCQESVTPAVPTDVSVLSPPHWLSRLCKVR